MCFIIEGKLFKEIGCSHVTGLSGVLFKCLEVKFVLVLVVDMKLNLCGIV